MSRSGCDGAHPPVICAATASIRAALVSARQANPTYLTSDQKHDVLIEIPSLIAQLSELNYRVMACGDDLATTHGARNIGDHIAHHTNQTHSALARDLKLARALDTTRPLLQAALRHGEVNIAQTIEIARALDRLPDTLDTDVIARAEAELVARAATFGPLDLRRLGRRILDIVAPEIAEAQEAERLADLERSAHQRQRLTLHPQGDGTTRITGLLTDACANRLATFLNSFTNPRRNHLVPAPCGCTANADGGFGRACGDLDCPGHDRHEPLTDPTRDSAGDAGSCQPNPIRRMSTPRRTAIALNSLLESLDPHRLPWHGGDATTIVVTLDYETLQGQVGTAILATARDSWHDRITAAEARRLACNAQIIPAVLGGDSIPLDLGRARRLFSPAQRKALAINNPYCQAEGCRIPNTWTEAHHEQPWHHGGPTDLDNALLLCSRHHHIAHDPHYNVERMPYGGVRFTRRT